MMTVEVDVEFALFLSTRSLERVSSMHTLIDFHPTLIAFCVKTCAHLSDKPKEFNRKIISMAAKLEHDLV